MRLWAAVFWHDLHVAPSLVPPYSLPRCPLPAHSPHSPHHHPTTQVSVNDCVIKAVAMALAEVPAANALWDAQQAAAVPAASGACGRAGLAACGGSWGCRWILRL